MAFNSPDSNSRQPPCTNAPNGEGNHAIAPPEQALICAYAGVGLTTTEIADRLDRHRHTIREYPERLRDRAVSADDPLDVYADVIGPALAVDPDCGIGGDAL